MIVFSDLHLREQSEDVCFRVLDRIAAAARDSDHHVVCCGDFWNIRYQVNVRLLNRVHAVLEAWGSEGIAVDFLPGNHDQVDVSGRNALEVFEAHEYVTVWTDPGTYEVELPGGELVTLGFVPYRKDIDVQRADLTSVLAHKPTVVFGHFGIHGAIMNSGQVDQGGLHLPASDALVVLGHYHKHYQHVETRGRRERGWVYVGSPYQVDFGEVGNVCGFLTVDPAGRFAFDAFDVSAPRHCILRWDPVEQEAPPALPDGFDVERDHVRLDIKASQETIVEGKFKAILKRSGLDQVRVNVVPVQVSRDAKMAIGEGETLLAAARRFAAERLAGEALDAPIAALERWAE